MLMLTVRGVYDGDKIIPTERIDLKISKK